MELDLFALVGDGVDAFLVTAQGNEVALAVVAAKEVEQVREDFVLQRRHVDG